MQPEKEIETALVKIEIEAERTRNSTASKIIIIIGFAVSFFIAYYFNQQYSLLAFVDVMIILLGGIYIVLSGIPKLIQPLAPEYYAVKNIADAIHVLEKLKEDIAYEKAYRKVETAYSTLKDVDLTDGIAWYETTNETFREFLKNLKLIVLPAIKDSNVDSIMKIEHLKHIALAIYSLDPAKLDAINKTLETEPSYPKRTVLATMGILQIASEFFRTHNILRHSVVILSLFVGCVFFYYMVVNYLDVPSGYALTASVAAFLGLLAMCERGRPAQKWSSA